MNKFNLGWPQWALGSLWLVLGALGYRPQAVCAMIFDHLEENQIFYKAQGESSLKSFKVNIHELSYLGTLQPPDLNTPPYFILSGKPCQNCLDDRSIYALRPGRSKIDSFVYPGRIIDPKTRALVFESRAFLGKCLLKNPQSDVYVVFQKEKVDRRKFLQASVLVSEAAENHLQETLLERHLPPLAATLQLVKKGKCREVEGRNRIMLPIPLDLHPKNNSDDEEEELEKEKGNKAID